MLIKRDKPTEDLLVNYIKTNLEKDYKIDQLRWALVKQGHSRVLIEQAIQRVEEEIALKKPKQNIPISQPKIEVLEEPQQEKKGFFKKLFG